MLVRYSYSRSTLLVIVIVSRYVLAVAKAPWFSVSVLCHAGTVLVCVAGIGYLVITGALLVKANPPDCRLPTFPYTKHTLTACPTNSNLLSTLRARSTFYYLHRDLITAATRRCSYFRF